MTSPTPLIGVSSPMLKIKELINHVAQTSLNILITGETGVGKEVVAQSLHAESNRSKNSFVKINCAALPETLLESELYGYEKGAFTGAHKKRYGKFLTADKGVLFLDEIGDMPLSLQSKMLHVLQSGEFSPLGSDQDFKTDVWVIAATNQCLEENIKNKTFREDLFYRLNIIKIDIPPLRERPEDIPALIEYYYKKYLPEHPNIQAERPDKQIMERLCRYHWPGNVRQLQNCIKKQMVLNSWDKIFDELPNDAYITGKSSSENTSQGQLPGSGMYSPEYKLENDPGNRRLRIISEFVDLSTSSEKLFEDISLKKIKKLASDKVEKEVIIFVLEKVGWNRSKAAKILKVSYKTLLYKMSEFDVNPPIS
nr:sigma-54 dependent transcriptional regulator [uncultured Desulfobacter sp.]